MSAFSLFLLALVQPDSKREIGLKSVILRKYSAYILQIQVIFSHLKL